MNAARTPGFAYDLPGGYKGLQCTVRKDLSLDKAKMTATGIFVSSNPDRVGDVIEVAGIKLENHQRNPIVFWDHGYGLRLPIGQTVDAAGKYLVELKPEEGVGYATTVFSQRIPEAVQVYALIDEGILRAQSIGFRCLKAESIREENRFVGEHILECEMLETSWTALPCNPDAVRSVLSNGLQGEKLSPVLRKSLLPFAARPKAWANGATLEKRPMPDEKKPQGPAETKGAPPAKTKAEDTAAAPAKPAEKPDAEEEAKDDESGQEPHGAQVLRAIHACCSEAVERVEALMGPLENDDVKVLAESHLDSLKDAMGEVEEAFTASYPKLDLAAGKSDDEEGEGEEEKDDDEEEAEEKAEDDDETEEKSDDEEDDEHKGDEDMDDEEKALLERRLKVIEAQIAHKKRLQPAAD